MRDSDSITGYREIERQRDDDDDGNDDIDDDIDVRDDSDGEADIAPGRSIFPEERVKA